MEPAKKFIPLSEVCRKWNVAPDFLNTGFGNSILPLYIKKICATEDGGKIEVFDGPLRRFPKLSNDLEVRDCDLEGVYCMSDDMVKVEEKNHSVNLVTKKHIDSKQTPEQELFKLKIENIAYAANLAHRVEENRKLEKQLHDVKNKGLGGAPYMQAARKGDIARSVSKELPQGGSRPETDKIKATNEACAVIVAAIREGQHLDSSGAIGRDEFADLVRLTMAASGEGHKYHITTARNFFQSSQGVQRFKRKRGRKKVS
jgi:hypothetical protein